MADAADMTPDEILAELTAMGLDLARDLHAEALAAQGQAKADLTLAFHRISRSIRQSLALKARLERDQRQAAREAANDAARQTLDRVQKKRSQIRRAISHDVWSEYEGDEAEALLDDLDAWVYEASEDEAFLDAPVELLIARIRENLGLAANAGEPDGEDPEVVIRQSG
jgi:hypothetical protein